MISSKGWYISRLKDLGISRHLIEHKKLEAYKTYIIPNLYYGTKGQLDKEVEKNLNSVGISADMDLVYRSNFIYCMLSKANRIVENESGARRLAPGFLLLKGV